MTHSDCSEPINNLTLSKIVDFRQRQPSVMKKIDKKTMAKQFWVNDKYLM